MIESIRSVLADPSYPSLHVLLVHFPIALIFTALLFDLGCLVARSSVWLDRAAAALYLLGTIGAGAAYLAGEHAAESLGNISPTAEAALADHEGSATITLIALVIVTLVRLWVSWLSRNDRRISLGIFRLAALPMALAALALVAVTADRGGNLVYRHGLGVQMDEKEPSGQSP
jgi:uncharacterized membrane protein